jgi:DNA-3-methyladenine glycosylase I
MASASPNLAALAKSYEITRKRAPRSVADLPKTTTQAEAFATQLKSQGYRFVGPTSVYAFMQNAAWSTTISTAASVRATNAPRPRGDDDEPGPLAGSAPLSAERPRVTEFEVQVALRE